MHRKAKIFLMPFSTLSHSKPSENFPQFAHKLTNLQSPWFSDDNCPVEIKPASFQEFVLLIHTGMSEKGIWLTYFHQTVAVKHKLPLWLCNVVLISLCRVHLQSPRYWGIQDAEIVPTVTPSRAEVVELFRAQLVTLRLPASDCLFVSVALTEERGQWQWERGGSLDSYWRVRLILTKNFCSTWCFIFSYCNCINIISA